jgi:hypothetical protein
MSSARDSSTSPMRGSIRPRSRGAICAQPGNATEAAVTARSTSAALPRGISAMTCRRAGFSTGKTSPEALSTQFPSISIRARRISDADSLRTAPITAMTSSSRPLSCDMVGIGGPSTMKG